MNKEMTLDIDGIKISYQDSLEGETKIFFIHGNSLSKEVFRKQYQSNLTNKYRLISIDLPGHGNSQKREESSTYSLPYYARILELISIQLDCEDAFFIGHSLGGHILIEAIHRLNKAKGFFIFSTPPISSLEDFDKAFLSNPNQELLFKEYLERDEASTFVNETLGKVSENDFFIDQVCRTDTRARTEMLESLIKGQFKDEVKVLKDCSQAYALVHAQNDPFTNHLYIQSLNLKNTWRGNLITLKDSGHSPQLESADQFNKLLDNFIRESS